jgi:hypothetical protein
MKINLLDYGGEFCTRRSSPAIPIIISIIESCISKNENLEIDTTGVKLIGPSFIDEILPRLIIKYGSEKVLGIVTFSPPLEGYTKDQVTIGVKNRK